MKAADRILDSARRVTGRQKRKLFVRSLGETAARAVVTATVTFAVGWMLKKTFEKSVAEAAEKGAKAGAEDGANPPPDVSA